MARGRGGVARGRRYPIVGLLCAVLAAGALESCGGVITGPDPGTRPDGGGPGGGDAGAPRLLRLIVQPNNSVLRVDLNTEGQQAFTVNGIYSDGRTQDFTAEASFRLLNASVGRFDGSSFRSVSQTATRIDFSSIEVRAAGLSAFANLTVVWLRTSGTQQDFFFSLPYQGSNQEQPLAFSTRIQSIDSFFAVDTTGSMVGEIQNLQSSLQNIIIPGVRNAAVRDAWFGVGAIDDFPVAPYGYAPGQCNDDPNYPDDQPFFLLSPMRGDALVAQAAVGRLLYNNRPRGCGYDVPEGQLEALYQIATGVGNVVPGVVNIPAHRSPGRGGVEFRDGALPIVTLITDASFHTKGETSRTCSYRNRDGVLLTDMTAYAGSVANAAHTRSETVTALNNLCAKVVGVSSLNALQNSCLGTDDLVQMARATGAVVPPVAWDLPQRPVNCPSGQCCTGLEGAGEAPGQDGMCPLVFKINPDGSGLGSQVSSGITQLARFASFDVVTDKSGGTTGERGEALPAGKTTADFLKSIVPLDATAPPAPPVIAAPVIQGQGFTRVVPGSLVRFTVQARNDFQPEQDQPQIFRATIRVRAGGCADLDQREVIILVPPRAPIIG